MKDIFQKYISCICMWYVIIVIYSSLIYKINITFHVDEQYMYIINSLYENDVCSQFDINSKNVYLTYTL